MYKGAFQLHKVRQALKRSGTKASIKTQKLDEFNEPTEETVSHEILGLYHEFNSTDGYSSSTTNDASVVYKKPIPMFLCLWESVKDVVYPEDDFYLNGKLYKVNAVKNLYEANLIAEVSLEEVQA